MTFMDLRRCLPLLLALACSKTSDAPPASADSARATTVSGSNGASAPVADHRTWTVTERGYGPVLAGMTLAEARIALGDTLSIPRPTTPSAAMRHRRSPRAQNLPCCS